MKIDRRLVKYEAVLLLRKATGWGDKRITKTLNKLGIPVALSTVKNWLYHDRAPYCPPSPLIKALLYDKAHQLVKAIKEKYPDWGATRIRKKSEGYWEFGYLRELFTLGLREPYQL